jgi:hypothetical protein
MTLLRRRHCTHDRTPTAVFAKDPTATAAKSTPATKHGHESPRLAETVVRVVELKGSEPVARPLVVPSQSGSTLPLDGTTAEISNSDAVAAALFRE